MYDGGFHIGEGERGAEEVKPEQYNMFPVFFCFLLASSKGTFYGTLFFFFFCQYLPMNQGGKNPESVRDRLHRHTSCVGPRGHRYPFRIPSDLVLGDKHRSFL